jgi:hypothetical protein
VRSSDLASPRASLTSSPPTVLLSPEKRSPLSPTASVSLSPKTVANYVSNILHKLQVADRKEAAVRAREAGLGQEDKP